LADGTGRTELASAADEDFVDPLAFDPSVAFVGIETFDGFLFARGPHASDLGEFGLFADAQMD
jgi:hypothetical protein